MHSKNLSSSYYSPLFSSTNYDAKNIKTIPIDKPTFLSGQLKSDTYSKNYRKEPEMIKKQDFYARSSLRVPQQKEEGNNKKKLDGFLRNTSYFSVNTYQQDEQPSKRLEKSQILEGTLQNKKRNSVQIQSTEKKIGNNMSANYNKIMEKLDKNQKIISQLKKLSQFKVSNQLRTSQQKDRDNKKNEQPYSKFQKNRNSGGYNSNLFGCSNTEGFGLTTSTVDSFTTLVKQDLSRSTADNINHKLDISANYLKEKAQINKQRQLKKQQQKVVKKNPQEDMGRESFKKIKNSYYTPKESKAESQFKKQTRYTPKNHPSPIITPALQKYIKDESNRQANVDSKLYNSCSYSYQNIDITPYTGSISTEPYSASSIKSKQNKKITDIRSIVENNRIRTNTTYFSKKLTIYEFDLGKSLGEGKFGTVFQAIHRDTQSLYALKKISKKSIIQNMMVDQILQEIKIQSFCNHENILKIYGFFDDAEFVYLILQYMEEGTLFNELKKCKTLPEQKAAVKLRQVTQAICYLHAQGIAHRDIKPENIVKSHGVGKLCDFGWAAICTDRRKTYCGTFDYAAPQILQGNQYDMSVDLWCLGVLAFELLVGKAPFYHISRKETIKKILNVEKTSLEFPPNMSKDAISFVENLLRRNPEERMDSQQLLKHPFLANATEYEA